MKSSETYPTAFAKMFKVTRPSIVSREYSMWLSMLREYDQLYRVMLLVATDAGRPLSQRVSAMEVLKAAYVGQRRAHRLYESGGSLAG